MPYLFLSSPRLAFRAPLLALLLSALLVVGCDTMEADEETLQRTELPPPSGPFGVGTTTLYLIDAERDDPYTPAEDSRELIVQLWYPTDATGAGAPYMDDVVIDLFAAFQDYTSLDSMAAFTRALTTNSVAEAPLSNAQPTYPVVFYSHGLGGVRSLYTTFIEDLASQGYVVVGPDHTFGAFATAFPDGRVEVLRRDVLPFEVVVQTWAEDLSFVLDVLEARNQADERFLNRLRLDQVGAIGHSTGGSAAVQVHTFDERFAAAASLDGPQVGTATTEGLNDPLLLFFANPSDFFATALQDGLRAPGYQVTVDATSHYSFTDLPILLDYARVPAGQAQASVRPPGTLAPDLNLEIIAAYTHAFFDRHLQGDSAPLLDGVPPYAEVELRALGGVMTGPLP